MLRAYVIIVIAIGIAASLIGHRPSSASGQPSSSNGVEMVRPPAPQAQVDSSSAPSQSVNSLDGSAVQLQRQPNGHFYADVDVNGATVTMMVDTGASGIALSRDDAQRAGIATSIGMNDVVGRGADGDVHGEFVTVERITLGPASAEKVPAMVLNGGEQSLLGQSFLQKFAAVEIHGNTMTLR